MSQLLISPEAKEMIGKETPLGGTLEIEKGAVLKLARAIHDTNPIYTDEKAAKRSKHGKLLVPVTFFDYNVPSGDEREITWQIPFEIKRRVRGKDEIELLQKEGVVEDTQKEEFLKMILEKHYK